MLFILGLFGMLYHVIYLLRRVVAHPSSISTPLIYMAFERATPILYIAALKHAVILTKHHP